MSDYDLQSDDYMSTEFITHDDMYGPKIDEREVPKDHEFESEGRIRSSTVIISRFARKSQSATNSMETRRGQGLRALKWLQGRRTIIDRGRFGGSSERVWL